MTRDRGLIIVIITALVLVPGAYGISMNGGTSIAVSGSSSAQGYSVADDSSAISEMRSVGSIDSFESSLQIKVQSKKEKTKDLKETNEGTDFAGKHAETYVKVLKGQDITYSSQILPEKIKQKETVSELSAEEWLTVSQAESIECKSLASDGGSLSADVGIVLPNGGSLDGYYNNAYASATDAYAIQTATGGSGDTIQIYGHANDGSGPLSVDTSVNGISGLAASFRDLDASSYAGTDTKVTQKEHITGSFTSTVVFPSQIDKTRSSNYGTEYDLDMQAIKGSAPTGTLGYYVNPGMATETLGAIQGGVNAAESGDTINAATGTYNENVVIDKSLSVNGAGAGTDPAKNTIVDGHQAGSVFTIGGTDPSANVALSGMTIQGGTGTLTDFSGTNLLAGGGIWNAGTLTVTGSTISANTAKIGGGIYNGGTLNLNNVEITGNTVTTAGDGGGIFNEGGTVNMNSGSSITGNTAYDGGGILNRGGTVNMNSGSSITGNTAYFGGGIENNAGTVNMNSGSSIAGNTAKYQGGGIFNEGAGTVNMNSGSSIAGNTASLGPGGSGASGGGILNQVHGTVNMYDDSSIAGNIADYGGGILNQVHGTVNMYDDSSIAGNAATKWGGGICNYDSTVNMYDDSSIADNTATKWGGGIYNYDTGTVNMNGGSILGNIANSGVGAGIASDGNVILNKPLGEMDPSYSSIVTVNNEAKIQDGVTLASSGGKVDVAAGTYTENVRIDKSVTVNGAGAGNTIVDGNQAGSVFTIGGTDPSANVALLGMTIQGGTGTLTDFSGTNLLAGGGIWNAGTLTLNAVTITGNTAVEGAGIYNKRITGTVNMYAGTTITGNKATGYWVTNGGGIFNDIQGTVNMYAGSSITGNTADGTGYSGGIENCGTVNMHPGSSISGNTAYIGGGMHINGGILNMYMGSSMTSNTATYGGGISTTNTAPYPYSSGIIFRDAAGNFISAWPGYDTVLDPYGFFTPHNIPSDIY